MHRNLKAWDYIVLFILFVIAISPLVGTILLTWNAPGDASMGVLGLLLLAFFFSLVLFVVFGIAIVIREYRLPAPNPIESRVNKKRSWALLLTVVFFILFVVLLSFLAK